MSAVESPVDVVADHASSFVARQPIYDRALEVRGYELLFRDALGTRPDEVDPDVATSRTLVATVADVGLDTLVGGVPGFVNVTERFLLDDYALLLPPERVALEVLESVEPTPELAAKLAELARAGYTIVLDDFDYTDERRSLLAVAHVVKLDVLTRSREQLAADVAQLAPYRVRLLAEKVEDYETLEVCRGLGFELFQGYFFCRPKTIAAEAIPVASLGKLQLIASLNDPLVSLQELELIIGRDVGLSYRLLRLVNSSFFSLRRRVESIRDAMVILGHRNVKNWATLLVLADVDDRPSELGVTAMVRARLCELVARATGRADAEAAFTVGLFSVIDAFLDNPLERILEQLPLHESVQSALLAHGGELGAILEQALAYERGAFDDLGASRDELPELYLAALAWAGEASQVMVAGG